MGQTDISKAAIQLAQPAGDADVVFFIQGHNSRYRRSEGSNQKPTSDIMNPHLLILCYPMKLLDGAKVTL